MKKNINKVQKFLLKVILYFKILDESVQNKPDMRNLLGFINQNLYHDYLNISTIMKLRRLDFRDIYGIKSPELMLTRENLIERTMLLVTSYFWIGTELRFWKQYNVGDFKDIKDAEFWHSKALELAIKFLPGDAPLVKHITSSYIKHHSPSSELIPENMEVDSNVKIIRPNLGIFYNKIAPVIRDIPRPSVTLGTLDIKSNWYITKHKSKESINSSVEQNQSSQFQNIILSERISRLESP